MATKQSYSPNDQPVTTPVPTLDESLAQLEEALDIFASNHDPKQYGEGAVLTEASAQSSTQPAAKPFRSVEDATLNEQKEAEVKALRELTKKAASEQPLNIPQWSGGEMVALQIEDDDTPKRRFPVFTDARLKMILLAVGLIAFFALIGYLIWWKQKSDATKLAAAKQEEIELRTPLATLPPPANDDPTPASAPVEITSGDKTLADNIKQILVAYNPNAVGTPYRIEVKDGIVTLHGEARSQMEKDGAESVIKPLAGIKKIVNNLNVKAMSGAPGGLILASGPNGPVMYPKVNDAEARKLDEAYLRELQENTKRAKDEANRLNGLNAPAATQRPDDEAAKREAENTRRQQTATIQNEETAKLRQEAEARLKQEKDDYEKRMEAERKAESERRQRAEAARQPNELRSGTVTWSGVVKGVEDIVIVGSSASVNHVSGEAGSNIRASFSAPVPSSPVAVKLVASNGRAPIRIVQQPNAGNNFTTIVRVGDGGKADGKPHSFSLRWSAQ